MGQSAYATLSDSFFRDGVLGLYHVADSVTGGAQPSALVTPADSSPFPRISPSTSAPPLTAPTTNPT